MTKQNVTRQLIKICGLSTFETLMASLDAGADMVGFVRFEKSPRHVKLELAAELAVQARGKAKSVVLTVDASDDELDAIVKIVSPDMVQLHGHESAARVTEIAARYRLPVIKALGVAGPEDLSAIERYRNAADILLIDAKPPPGASLPGGNGMPFDWTLLGRIDPALPLMLSGGLSPDNVAEAIRRTNITAIDVSSGIEKSRGVKDIGKIRAFIRNARAAWEGNTE